MWFKPDIIHCDIVVVHHKLRAHWCICLICPRFWRFRQHTDQTVALTPFCERPFPLLHYCGVSNLSRVAPVAQTNWAHVAPTTSAASCQNIKCCLTWTLQTRKPRILNIPRTCRWSKKLTEKSECTFFATYTFWGPWRMGIFSKCDKWWCCFVHRVCWVSSTRNRKLS